ncbi:hypothetical protein SCOR_32095 [Sulfidibacter corallicola]
MAKHRKPHGLPSGAFGDAPKGPPPSPFCPSPPSHDRSRSPHAVDPERVARPKRLRRTRTQGENGSRSRVHPRATSAMVEGPMGAVGQGFVCECRHLFRKCHGFLKGSSRPLAGMVPKRSPEPRVGRDRNQLARSHQIPDETKRREAARIQEPTKERKIHDQASKKKRERRILLFQFSDLCYR